MSTPEMDWSGVVDYAKRYEVDPPKTQYELPGVTEEMHEGVPVVVPPLWHAVVTAKLAIPADQVRAAQKRLVAALAELEGILPLVPSGLYVQIGYGLPYFQRYVSPAVADAHMPRSTMAGSEGQWALVDSIRFPKDPQGIVLEDNDICFHFKSDHQQNIEEAIEALFRPGKATVNGLPVSGVYIGDCLTLTSIRRGFVGRNMPKLMALRHGIPGAERIPDGAELFMGFTSSHLHGLASGNLPSFETLPGYTDQTPDSYFAHGTAMHLSHIEIDIQAWYGLDHRARLHHMFHPRRTEGEKILSPSQAPETSTFRAQRDEDAARYRVVGHNEQMQFLSRLEHETTTAYGKKLPRGTVFFLRQDFDTVDNPFAFWAGGPLGQTPKAGVHFIGFGPSAQHFEKMRLEMDGVELQRAQQLADQDVGFTKFLVTTHRQNFLLPPRAHRAFPLAELDG